MATADFLASAAAGRCSQSADSTSTHDSWGSISSVWHQGTSRRCFPSLCLQSYNSGSNLASFEAVTGFSVDWSKAISYNRDGYMVVNTTPTMILSSIGSTGLDISTRRCQSSLGLVQRRRPLPAWLGDVLPMPDSSPALRHSTATPILRSLSADWCHCPSFHTDARRAVAGNAGSRTRRCAIDRVRIVIFESAVSWGPAPILEERLLQADWCPDEVKRLSAGMNVCNQYFASLLARSGSTSHEQCSSRHLKGDRALARKGGESSERRWNSCD